jgi:hypothetical protein
MVTTSSASTILQDASNVYMFREPSYRLPRPRGGWTFTAVSSPKGRLRELLPVNACQVFLARHEVPVAVDYSHEEPEDYLQELGYQFHLSNRTIVMYDP